MKWLRQWWQGVWKRGELDLYVTIVVSIGVFVLDLIDVLPTSWVPPLTVAVLGLLSLTVLGNRRNSETELRALRELSSRVYSLERRVEQGASADELIQSAEKLPPLTALLGQCEEVCVSGKDLASFLRNYLGDIEQAARAGKVFRLMICDPHDQELMRCLAAVSYLFPDAQDRQESGESALSLLKRLISTAPEGTVKVRLSRCIPTNSYLIVDGTRADGQMTVQMYGYQIPRAQRRHMHLTRLKDVRTFDYFLQQFEGMWNSAECLSPESCE